MGSIYSYCRHPFYHQVLASKFTVFQQPISFPVLTTRFRLINVVTEFCTIFSSIYWHSLDEIPCSVLSTIYWVVLKIHVMFRIAELPYDSLKSTSNIWTNEYVIVRIRNVLVYRISLDGQNAVAHERANHSPWCFFSLSVLPLKISFTDCKFFVSLQWVYSSHWIHTHVGLKYITIK